MTHQDTPRAHDPIPTPILAWGLAGLVPFLGLPALALIAPGQAAWADQGLGLYAAVILSFLGGARWGLEVSRASIRPRVVALSMAPSVAAWGLVLTPASGTTVQLTALAVALVLSWRWDRHSAGLPSWYARLRSLLTAGALAGLAAGILI